MDERRNLQNKFAQLPTWRALNRDTSPQIDEIIFQKWRETPAWRKLELMESLNKSARQLSIAGIRNRYPNATDDEIKFHLAKLVLGEELAKSAYENKWQV